MNNKKLLNIAGVDSYTVGTYDLDAVLNKLPQKDQLFYLLTNLTLLRYLVKLKDSNFKYQDTHMEGNLLFLTLIQFHLESQKSTKFPVGKYKVKNMIQYTSRGLGTNTFWIRVNCKPEITLFNLKSNKKRKQKLTRFLWKIPTSAKLKPS